MTHPLRHLPLLLALPLAACIPLDKLFPTDGGTATDGATAADAKSGFGQATLQVTVNGVHFGPAAPDNGSAAALVNAYNQAGRIYQSRFQLQAQSTAAKAACAIDIQRVGDGVSSIGAGPWIVGAGAGARTADGEVDPVTGLGIQIPQGTWQCVGAACEGGAFVLRALDDKHAEGYVQGVYQNFQSGTAANVVCSFWVPVVRYEP